MGMNEVKKDWALSYNKENFDITKEIDDIDVFDQKLAKILLEHFRSGDLVLEAGCGTGKFCFWLNRRGIKSIGVDIIAKTIEQATQYAKAKGFQISFMTSDVSNVSLRDNCLDGYISLGVLEHFRSKTEVTRSLEECKRILKPGGKAIILIPNIFVPLRNRILLKISKNKIGFFHEFYTLNDIYHLGKIIGSNSTVEVINIWIHVYNILSGILKKLRINNRILRKIRFAFTKLPSYTFLRYFLGDIFLIVEKPRL